MNAEIKTGIIFGGLIAAAVVFLAIIFIGLDESISINSDLGIRKAPNLVGISHYLNTSPEKLSEDMENKVILYDIWTYSCVNCIRTLPYITAWDEKYADQGLLIIGIHSPEFEFEKKWALVVFFEERKFEEAILKSAIWLLFLFSCLKRLMKGKYFETRPENAFRDAFNA